MISPVQTSARNPRGHKVFRVFPEKIDGERHWQIGANWLVVSIMPLVSLDLFLASSLSCVVSLVSRPSVCLLTVWAPCGSRRLIKQPDKERPLDLWYRQKPPKTLALYRWFVIAKELPLQNNAKELRMLKLSSKKHEILSPHQLVPESGGQISEVCTHRTNILEKTTETYENAPLQQSSTNSDHLAVAHMIMELGLAAKVNHKVNSASFLGVFLLFPRLAKLTLTTPMQRRTRCCKYAYIYIQMYLCKPNRLKA